jgi:hypothetical protein
MEDHLYSIASVILVAFFGALGIIWKYFTNQVSKKERELKELRKENITLMNKNTELAVNEAKATEQLLLRSRGKNKDGKK